MSDNRINTTLTEAELAELIDTFKQMREKLPFLLTLSAKEKDSLIRLSDKNRLFMSKILEIATQHPDLLPARFNLETLRNDVVMDSQIFTLRREANLFVEALDDTYRLVGNEAYTECLAAYKYFKAANVATGELDDAMDELGKMFLRKMAAPEPEKV